MTAGISPREFDELPDDLQETLRPRVERLGYLGDFFRYCGHQPAALSHFYQFTEDLKAALPDDLTQTVALTIATVTGNDYERSQHEQLCRNRGFSDAWISIVVGRDPKTSGLSADQQLARSLSLAVQSGNWIAARIELERLTASHGQTTAVGILLLIARYLAHSAICNTLGLSPPVPFVIQDRESHAAPTPSTDPFIDSDQP